MKRLFLMLCPLLLTAGIAKANPVDGTTARKAATTFLRSAGCKAPDKLTDISAAMPFSQFYTFDIDEGHGFILIAGDDCSEPVLAYALDGKFDPVGMPPHVRAWLQGYEEEIAHNRHATTAAPVAAEQWRCLRQGRALPTASKAAVEPMLSTTWNQSPYYNKLCPYDSANSGRAVAGCTAIATAQIMKHFEHPATGYGSCTYTHSRLGDLSADYNTTYQWDSMPASLTANTPEGQVDATATLIYHCGVAVSMNYSASGSGGKTASYGYGGEASSENALKYNFKYSPYVWTAFRIDYSLNDWRSLLKNEINNGRPILYAGYDEVQSGHAFVADGYNNLSYFHFNWGWGGRYDGYYRIQNLNPTSDDLGPSGYHFDLFATATIGIEPFDHFGEATTTVTTATEGIRGASATDGTVSGAGTYNFGDTITLTALAANEHTRFVQWSDGCKYNPRGTVATGGTVNFTAQFAPLRSDTVRYHTCDNAMNRATNVPEGLGTDSVWGIKIPAAALRKHHNLTAVQFMGRKQGTVTLTVYKGTDSPTEVCYSATFVDSLDYDYTFHTHTLATPVTVDGDASLWIKLKCTDIDTPGVFSIYGGNPNSMLCGESLTSRGDAWKFSWMIEGLFTWDGTEGIDDIDGAATFALYPNPATDKVTVSLPHAATAAQLRISDINGRTVRQLDMTGGTMLLDISGLAPGIYLLTLTDGPSSAVQKLVVR